MIKNEDIICISSIDWDFVWQGHQEIMTRLARGGNRVLFIENTGVRAPRISDLGRIRKRIVNWKSGLHGIRKIEDGLYVYSPIVFPFPYLRIARLINRKIILSVLFKWLKAVGFHEPIIWVFLPTGLSLDLINRLDPKVLVYYCIDSFKSSSKDAQKIQGAEEAVIKKSDLVFCTSKKLQEHCSRHNKNVFYFPFGVNIENFRKAGSSRTVPPGDIGSIKKPIAGYIGGIHKWIDFDLVRYVAEANKDISFAFCGPIQTDIEKVKDMPNVIFLGQKRPEELPLYVKAFDVAMIPYRLTEYTNNVYPTKLNEYLSLGKAVVSTHLPEVVRFSDENKGLVRVSRSREDFARLIRDLADHPINDDEASRAIIAAEKNSWTRRLEEMSLLIEKEERKKEIARETLWKDNLKNLYRKTGKMAAVALAASLALYGLLFYTPLLWITAGPLYMKDLPARSDVIAALGAGVGESGRAGQGYQERVDTAVRLYNKGFAGKIIYSSGYRYIMKEAEIMKALSVSMGVDGKDVIVDESAGNTFEMITRLRDICVRNGWRKVIIVSSPYHMLRLKLLCDKAMGGIGTVLIPTEESSFYARGPSVTAAQIRGILHEYIAMVYYKYKGYI